MVYFVSQLQTIDPNLYEAAKIDGATNSQIIMRITLPLMRPAVSFVTITSLVGGFLLFDLIFIVYGGAGVGMFGPGDHAKLFVPYIYYYAFDKSPTQIGLASAAGWMVFFLIAVINIIQIRVLGLGSAKEE
jgi:ABC-type sugar transport system permease subunit